MRKVLSFTSTRADYGLLRPLLAQLDSHRAIELGLLVSGTHLDARHGCTVNSVLADGYTIVNCFPMFESAVEWDDLEGEVRGTSGAFGRVLADSVDVIHAWKPNLAMVLGDRFEAMAFALACHLCRVPLAHIHGGEVTSGAIDDAFRHAITKMAVIHLVAANEFGRRVAQLGESEASIHVVGALGLDAIATEAGRLRSLPRDGQCLLAAIHPTTLVQEPVERMVDAIVGAASDLKLKVLFTGSNADPGSRDVRRAIERHQGSPNVSMISSLGPTRFPEFVYSAPAIIGNSSAGIIEAPFLGTPTINIGARQEGRPRASSVIDVPVATSSVCSLESRIRSAIEWAVDLKPRLIPFGATPYGGGGAAARIVDALTGTIPATVKGFVDWRDWRDAESD